MKTFVKGFRPALRDTDWFDWFYLVFIVFASVLFCAVVDELMEMFSP